MKTIKKLIAVSLSAVMILGMTACGDKGGSTGRKTKLQYWAGIGAGESAIINELVAAFNKTDIANKYNIEVVAVPKTKDYASSLTSALQGTKNVPNIVEVNDKYLKGFVEDGLLTSIDTYLNDNKLREKNKDGSNVLNLDDIWPSTLLRAKYDVKNHVMSDNAPLYGLPKNNIPSIMFYNVDQFTEQKVNIISVAEKDLSAYNEKEKTSYLPHGYYEYTTAPASGLTASADGKYRVFNNQICMNFEETVQLAKIFTKSYNSSSSSTYGYFTEWWFSYGWTVGGDCIQWDEATNQYKFTLGDQTPNYLVTGTDEITVNGTKYKAGDVIEYKDAVYVSANSGNADVSKYLSSQQLYKLPSQREAFTEFCRLSQSKGKTVDGTDSTKTGYGVSPNPTTLGNESKTSYFTSGKVAMIVNDVDSMHEFAESMNTLKKNWDVAPLTQYREYNADGTVKMVNGTAVVGKVVAHNNASALCIPQNSTNKEASWKFIEWMAGSEAQKIRMTAGVGVPNQISVATSDYLSTKSEYLPKNISALVMNASVATIGDWSYLPKRDWISIWSNVLNSDVRNGSMTLDKFFNQVTSQTNKLLEGYKVGKSSWR